MVLPRFYPILDTEVALRRGIDPVKAAHEILDTGVGILQFRHKGFLSREAFAWLEQIAKLTRAAGATLVVNDRADLAHLFGAWLHLGQDDLLPSIARRVIGPDTTVGYSTHNEAQLRAAWAEPADYLALGPVFGTATKENPDPTVGVDELRRLRHLSNRPLVATTKDTFPCSPEIWLPAGSHFLRPAAGAQTRTKFFLGGLRDT